MTITLDDDERAILDQLAAKLGIKPARVIGSALRAYASLPTVMQTPALPPATTPKRIVAALAGAKAKEPWMTPAEIHAALERSGDPVPIANVYVALGKLVAAGAIRARGDHPRTTYAAPSSRK